jgi:hypothetical protein
MWQENQRRMIWGSGLAWERAGGRKLVLGGFEIEQRS